MTALPAVLEHITLNSGDRRLSPRAEVRPDLVATLAADCRAGRYGPPLHRYKCIFVANDDDPRFAAVTVVRQATLAPQVSLFVAWDPARSLAHWGIVGSAVQSAREHVTDAAAGLAGAMPPPPAVVPWLAVLVWPTADPDALYWLGDFERCLAWSLIAERP